jgi:branched-chain amino acid transport system ATP-binding protein
MSLLTVKDLNAGYGRVPILRDVSFRVDDGEVVAIIGPNGAGKSTLLKSLSGLITPSGGTVEFDGSSIEGLPPHRITQSGISYIPEGGRLFMNMTVRDNLLMGAYAKRDILKTGVMEDILNLFPILDTRSRQYARTLSGGEKQMLAVGRGLISDPKLLMLDEPSLGLAPKLVDDIYEKFFALKERGLTVLLVEQNITYALELADRGYVLENGRIVMEGAGRDLSIEEHIKKHYLGLA